MGGTGATGTGLPASFRPTPKLAPNPTLSGIKSVSRKPVRSEKPGPPVPEAEAVIDLARTASLGPRRTSTLGAHPSAHNAPGVAAQPEILSDSAPVRVSPIISSTELAHSARKSQEPVLRSDGSSIPEHTFATRVAMGAAKSLLATLKLLHAPSKEVQEWLARAQRDIQKARANSQGLSSGDTMVIMARALVGLREHSEGTTRRWRRYLVLVLLGSVVLLGGASFVIYRQHQRINRMVSEKMAIDAEIQRVYAAMGVEQDEQKLSELDTKLQTLMKAASTKLDQVEKAAPKKAAVLERPLDPLDEEIKNILKSFNAETYAVPPVFRIELQRQINDILANKGVPGSLARKNQYWPAIQKALVKRQLPVELGYIAYTESRFDPTVVNAKSKATGMWQLMDETARKCGITVSAKRDDRTDPARSSSAAACYLSKLLVEFGEESFMLVLASYNRGENGVRNALHRVANEPGGFRKRDFWHLYRLKLLPDETRDYVPKVIAAAIVLGNPEKYGLQAKEPAGH